MPAMLPFGEKSLAVLVLALGLGSRASGQSCNTDIVGGAPEFGFWCPGNGFPAQILDSGLLGMQHGQVRAPGGGSGPGAPTGHFPAATLFDASGGVGNGGGGTIHAASGELQVVMHGSVVQNAIPLAGIHLFAWHRSFFAYPDGYTTPDVDGTGQLPFGAGWLASWGERLDVPGGAGQTVYRIEPSGVRRAIPASGNGYGSWPEVDPFLDFATWTSYVYPPDKGTRLIYDHVFVGEGQPLAGIWFREFPDRTRIEYEPSLVSGELRIRRIYYGPGDEGYADPRWQVQYTYDSGGRLVGVADPKGYLVTLTWADQDAGSGTAMRVTKMSTSHASWAAPSPFSWVDYDVTFEYRTSDYQLWRVHYPQRSYLFDANGNEAYDSGESYPDASLVEFAYQAIGDARISKIWRTIGGSAREVLSNSYYESTPYRWRVASQVEYPGLQARSQSIYSWGLFDLEWTDPIGVKHRYVSVPQSSSPYSSPLENRIVTYTRQAPDDDPRKNAPAPSNSGAQFHEQLTWQYQWDACGCGRLTSLTMPSGLRSSWTYDSAGRGLVTSTTVHAVGSGGGTRSWTWDYRPWGDPWSTTYVPQFDYASRLLSHTEEQGSNVWNFSCVVSGAERTTTITAPNGSASFVSSEDLSGRLLWTDGALFDAETSGGSGQSRARVTYTYGDPGTPDFQRLKYVTEFQGLGNSAPATTAFTYDALGNLVSVTNALGQVTTATYDRLGRITAVSLPQVSSPVGDPPPSYSGSITLDYDHHGGTARVTRTAHQGTGGGYANSSIVSETIASLYGEPIVSRVERGAMSSSSDLWLTVKRSFDGRGRLRSIQRTPGGQEVFFDLDSHDRLFRSRTRLKPGTDIDTIATREAWWTVDGALQVEVDATGVQTRYEYSDPYGRLSAVELPTAPARRMQVGSWLPQDRVGQIASSLGGTAQDLETYVYDALGRVTHMNSGAAGGGGPWSQRVFDYTGFKLKRAELVLSGGNRWVDYAYDPRGNLRREIDKLGNESIVHTRNALGLATELHSKLVSEDTSGGTSFKTYRTTYDYDTWGRVVQVTDHGSGSGPTAVGQLAYDSLNRVIWQRDARDKELRSEYDALGRLLVSRLRPRGGSAADDVVLTREYDHDPFSTVEGQHYAFRFTLRNDQGSGNHPTRYFYDLGGRLIREELPGFTSGPAHRKNYLYDAEGRLTEWTDGNNVVVQIARDAKKRPVLRGANVSAATVVPSLMTTAEGWDYSAETNREFTSQTYWGAWFATGVPQGLVGETVEFDELGRLERENYAYADTDLGFGVSPAHSDTLHSEYTMSGGGEDFGFRRALHLEHAQWRIRATPDAAGKLRSLAIQPTQGGGSASDLALYRYEGGRIASRDLHLGASGQMMRSLFGVDSLGILTSVEHVMNPGSQQSTLWKLTREVDVLGNVTKEKVEGSLGTGWTPAAYIDHYQLDGFDRVTGAKLRDQNLGNFGQSYASVGTYQRKLEYQLDKRQNINQVVETPSVGAPISTSFALEINSDRYASSTTTVGAAQSFEAYAYDGNGNLIQDGHYVYVYDYLDRLCEVYELSLEVEGEMMALGASDPANYNAEGRYARRGYLLSRENLHRKVGEARAHVARGELRAGDRPRARSSRMSSSASATSGEQSLLSLQLVGLYGYDTNHRRILRVTTADAHWNAYDGWQLVQETVETGDPALGWQVRKVYLDGQGIDEHLGYLSRSQFGAQSNWTRYNYVQHPLGHVHGVLNDAGGVVQSYRYSPYGQMEQPMGPGAFVGSPNRYGYAGRLEDMESRLKYYRHRYYSAAMGRFMSGDWIGPFGDGANWGNQYAYAGSAPIVAVDHYGLYTVFHLSDSLNSSEYAQAFNYALVAIDADPDGGAIVRYDEYGNKITTVIPGRPGATSVTHIFYGHGDSTGNPASDGSGTGIDPTRPTPPVTPPRPGRRQIIPAAYTLPRSALGYIEEVRTCPELLNQFAIVGSCWSHIAGGWCERLGRMTGIPVCGHKDVGMIVGIPPAPMPYEPYVVYPRDGFEGPPAPVPGPGSD